MYSYTCSLSNASVTNIKMFSEECKDCRARTNIRVSLLKMCRRVCRCFRLLNISGTQNIQSRMLKLQGDAPWADTLSAHFLMLLQADKQVFPTQVNWLHLCDQQMIVLCVCVCVFVRGCPAALSRLSHPETCATTPIKILSLRHRCIIFGYVFVPFSINLGFLFVSLSDTNLKYQMECFQDLLDLDQ